MWRICAVAATAAALQAPRPNAQIKTPVAVSTLEVPRIEVPADGSPMRKPIATPWDENKQILEEQLGFSQERLSGYDDVSEESLTDAYEMMQLCRQFENACAQSYMQGSIRGFMHLDNGQETIPALVADALTKKDKKYSYYREHTHALASGVPPNKIMAELFAKDGGTCRGTGGSMHIFDVETHFQGGWALVAEQFPQWQQVQRGRNPGRYKHTDRVAMQSVVGASMADVGPNQKSAVARALGVGRDHTKRDSTKCENTRITGMSLVGARHPPPSNSPVCLYMCLQSTAFV